MSRSAENNLTPRVAPFKVTQGHRISDRSATHDFLLVIHNHSTDFQTKFGVKVARWQRKRSIEFEARYVTFKAGLWLRFGGGEDIHRKTGYALFGACLIVSLLAVCQPFIKLLLTYLLTYILKFCRISCFCGSMRSIECHSSLLCVSAHILQFAIFVHIFHSVL